MSQSPPAAIDFGALASIDREVTQLVHSGGWSRESYVRLRDQALAALAGRVEGLSFIDLLAEPAWRIAPHEHLARMVPLLSDVRDVVSWALRGWRPFVALPTGQALLWNGRELRASRVEVQLRGDGSRIVADIEPGQVDSKQLTRVGIVRDTLQADLAHGWSFRSGNASWHEQQIRHEGDRVSETLTFRAYGGVVSRGAASRLIWIVPLAVHRSLPMGNLFKDREWFSRGRHGSSCGWVGLRFEGAYPYVLVPPESKRREANVSHSLVVDPGGRSLEPRLLATDLLALQFVLGHRIEAELAFGLDGSDIQEVLAVGGRGGIGRSGNTYDIVGPRHSSGALAVEFFERLSTAMRTSAPQLAGVLDIFLRSLDDLLDLTIQSLLLAIAALSPATSEAPSAHGTRAKRFLEAEGVSLPTDLVKRIDVASETLTASGRLSSDVLSDEDHAYLFDLRADLRTVVVAMVAIAVGYRGRIAARPSSDAPPAWWPPAGPEPQASQWIVVGPPEDAAHGVRDDQVLVLVADPSHAEVIRWLVRAADLPESLLVVASACSADDLREQVSHVRALGDRVLVVADAPRGHVPTASAHLRSELNLAAESVIVIPAVPCVESWLLADDELVAAASTDDDTRRRATESLPDDVQDSRSLAHQIFGPPELWRTLPRPDVFRGADRSPSLRHFIDVLATRLGVSRNLPARSVARGLSRDAIAGLIRSLLPDDAIAWRTSDGSIYTAAELAREIEQGTEDGRQYSVDLVSMMINTLSRSAKRSGPA